MNDLVKQRDGSKRNPFKSTYPRSIGVGRLIVAIKASPMMLEQAEMAKAAVQELDWFRDHGRFGEWHENVNSSVLELVVTRDVKFASRMYLLALLRNGPFRAIYWFRRFEKDGDAFFAFLQERLHPSIGLKGSPFTLPEAEDYADPAKMSSHMDAKLKDMGARMEDVDQLRFLCALPGQLSIYADATGLVNDLPLHTYRIFMRSFALRFPNSRMMFALDDTQMLVELTDQQCFNLVATMPMSSRPSAIQHGLYKDVPALPDEVITAFYMARARSYS